MKRTLVAIILALVALNVLTLCLSKSKVSVLNGLRYRAAMRHIDNKEYNKAEALFAKIVRTDPYDSRALRDLAQIHHMRGDKDAAIEFFSKAACLGDPIALDSLAGLYLEQTNLSQVAVLVPMLMKKQHTCPTIAEKLTVFAMFTTNRPLWQNVQSAYKDGSLPCDSYASNLNATATRFFAEQK